VTESAYNKILTILRKILEVNDVEVKNCALESLIEMIEELKSEKERSAKTS
jgi:hypothetical protein